MTYLVLKFLHYVIGAFLLGGLFGWYTCERHQD